MKIGKKTVLLGMLVLLCSLSFGMQTQAKPDKVVINFTFTMEVSGDAERLWLSDDGVWQIRETPHEGAITWSDVELSGSIFYLGNLILFDDLMAPTTFNSIGGGPFELYDAYYEGAAVGLYGRMHFEIENFYLEGTIKCHGSGAFEGMLLKGTYEGILGGPYTAQLVIWN